MRRLIFIDGGADGREEERFADPLEQSKPLQLVLHGVLSLKEFRDMLVTVREKVAALKRKAGREIRQLQQIRLLPLMLGLAISSSIRAFTRLVYEAV